MLACLSWTVIWAYYGWICLGWFPWGYLHRRYKVGYYQQIGSPRFTGHQEASMESQLHHVQPFQVWYGLRPNAWTFPSLLQGGSVKVWTAHSLPNSYVRVKSHRYGDWGVILDLSLDQWVTKFKLITAYLWENMPHPSFVLFVLKKRSKWWQGVLFYGYICLKFNCINF